MKLIEFIRQLQPLINAAELERLVGCPKRTIYNALLPAEKGGQPLPQKWVSDIVKTLCQKFGIIKIGADFIEWNETSFVFVVWSIAEEKDVIEHENHFEYPVSLSKDIYDEFDILELLM